jgi:glycolate oxidase
MKTYTRLSPELINDLAAIAGAANLSVSDADLINYAIDETSCAVPCSPEIIIKPTDTDMVSRVLSFARKHKIPVTPRGAGTGLSGGAIPIYGGILLSLEQMNRILQIDRENFVATVEAGVSLSQLNEELIKYDLCYPVRIGEMSATVGGNIATNAGGMNAVKYGVTRHQVLGLEAVLASGRIIETGGAFVKCSTGYDLTQLLTGSEGTLAVITTVMLKLMPLPAARELLLVPFGNLQNAIDTVPELLRLKTIPMGIEFMEKDVVQIVERHTVLKLPYHESEAFLMIIMEGDSSEDIVQYFQQIETICRKHGAIEFLVPVNGSAMKKLIQFREKVHDSVRREGTSVMMDIVVPRNQIAKFTRRVKAKSQEYGVNVITFGHAGDGNIHLYAMRNNIGSEEWNKKLPLLMKHIYFEGKLLGGMVSGEHGIGSEKKAYLPLTINKETLLLMKRIKKTFDPDNILNPGKIFDI